MLHFSQLLFPGQTKTKASSCYYDATVHYRVGEENIFAKPYCITMLPQDELTTNSHFSFKTAELTTAWRMLKPQSIMWRVGQHQPLLYEVS